MNLRVNSRSIPIFCVGILAPLLLLAPPARAVEVKSVSEKVFAFEPGGEIHVDNRNGRITVEAWDRPEVRIQITRTVRANEKRKADELIKVLKADVEVRGDRIDIVSRFPKRNETIGFWDLVGQKIASYQIHYYLQVPRETDATIETTNGGLRVRGLDGAVDGSTTNGDVEVAQVHGKVRLGTTNGEVRLTGSSGAANARTTNGSVIAELRELTADGELRLLTTNGNVQVYLPRDLKATLEASTTNGRVTVSYPLTTEGLMTSKVVRGTINGGGAAVSLATTNGNIELRRIGEGRPAQ